MNPQLLLLIQIATFIAYLYPQALLINGIYISAAGKTDILPDGTEADSEIILYPLYKYLNQSTTNKMFFTYASLKAKGIAWPIFNWGRIVWEDGAAQKVSITNQQMWSLESIATWATAYLNAKIIYNSNDQTVYFYQDVTTYKFSKYIRKPIITCVICMASFWSIFTFLIPTLLYYGPHLILFPIWIANVFCLAYLNYLIFKPRG